jgi:hypothetical protein
MHRAILLAAACAAALTTLAGGPATASGTYKYWDGTGEVTAFGCPNTTTYGQVITIPATKHFLNKFVFSFVNLNSGSMVLRGEVYAWDGQEATGSALWEGTPRTVSFNDGVFHRFHFDTGVIAVTPGQQYVIFASIDKDFAQCQNNYELGWGLVTSGDKYLGGGFVYQNNGGNPANWTTAPWNTFGGEDVAFRAELTP